MKNSLFSVKKYLFPFNKCFRSREYFCWTSQRHFPVLNIIIFTATRRKLEQKVFRNNGGGKFNHRNVETWETSNRSFLDFESFDFGVGRINSSITAHLGQNWQVVIHLQPNSFSAPCLHLNYRRPNPRKINLNAQSEKEGKLNNEFMKNACTQAINFWWRWGEDEESKLKDPSAMRTWQWKKLEIVGA